MTLYGTIAARSPAAPLLRDVATVVAASMLLVLSARLTVPFHPVPLSMQTFVAIGLGLALGPVRGTLAVLAYLAQGAAGLPVFAGTPEKGIGVAYMMGPTGGYLLGMAAQAAVAGFFALRGWDRRPVTAMLAALVAGVAIYPIGLLWLGAVIGFDKPVLALGLSPFILGDIAKAMLAALVFPAAWRLLSLGGAR